LPRILPAQLGGLALEAREQDVEVAHFAEVAAQLLQPIVEVRSVGRYELLPGTEQRPQAADGDPHLVEALRIAPETSSRVMPLDLA
jgi:hypothetical protein